MAIPTYDWIAHYASTRGDCVAMEDLASAHVPTAHAQNFRTYNPWDNEGPRCSLPQISPDRAGLRESTFDLFRRASPNDTRGRQSPNARRPGLPQLHASSSDRAPIAAAAERSSRYCVQDSKMRSWLSRKRTKAVDSLMLFADLGRQARRGSRLPCVAALFASNRG